MDAKLEHIKAVRLFTAASPDEIEAVAKLTQEISVESGKVLTRAGEPGRQVFVIMSGTARGEFPDGATFDLAPGEFFGELAILDQGPRVATVTATSHMDLLVLSSQEFLTALDTVPTLAHSVMRTLAHRLREAEEEHTH